MISQPDVVCVNESWFDNSITDQLFPSGNYVTASRCDRSEGIHGGSLIISKATCIFDNVELPRSVNIGCAS